MTSKRLLQYGHLANTVTSLCPFGVHIREVRLKFETGVSSGVSAISDRWSGLPKAWWYLQCSHNFFNVRASGQRLIRWHVAWEDAIISAGGVLAQGKCGSRDKFASQMPTQPC